MTIWEHCFWLEVERSKRLGLPTIEFAEVDKTVIVLSKTLEYVPPPEPSEGER